MKITINENGSIRIDTNGSYTVRHADGREELIEKPRVSLCRCGHSANKPFCDGAHKAAGFAAPGLELEIG
jgi:CDGSH iron-sulfur domain-containing protein 3